MQTVFKNSEGEEEKCVSKVLCKWFIKALIELLPLITFFWFWLANVLVVVVVLLEVKFWKRQSPVRRMMLSIKRESAKLFHQNKVSSYKIQDVINNLDGIRCTWILCDMNRNLVKNWFVNLAHKSLVCRGERDTKMVELLNFFSFNLVLYKFTITKELGCCFMKLRNKSAKNNSNIKSPSFFVTRRFRT